MKKTNKVKMGPLGIPLGNPLGYFNSLKSKRTDEPKQTLKKARNGIVAGPQTEMQSILSNAMSSQPAIPRPNRSSRDAMMQEMEASSRYNVDNANAMRSILYDKAANMNSNKALIEKAYSDALINGSKYNKSMLDRVDPKQKTTKGIVAGQEMEFTPEQMKSIFGIQRKGGSVKSKKK